MGGKGVPPKIPRLAQAEPSPGSLKALPFFDFWGFLWGGAVSARLLAFLDGDGEISGGGGESPKHLRCSRWASWVPSGRERRGASCLGSTELPRLRVLLGVLSEGQGRARQAMGAPEREDGAGRSKEEAVMGFRVPAWFPLRNSHSAWPRTGARSWLPGRALELEWVGGMGLEPSSRDSGRPNPPSRHTQRAVPGSGFHSSLAGCLSTAALICSRPERPAWR